MRRLCEEATNNLFASVEHFFEKGIVRGELKNVNTRLLMYYCYDPIVQLANKYYTKKLIHLNKNLSLDFQSVGMPLKNNGISFLF